MKLVVDSQAFRDGNTIPQKYTCDGDNISPALRWTGVPIGTVSYALIVDDPDAPLGTWVHWLIYDIPARESALPEAVQGLAVEGKNDFRRTGYGGPCPPAGKPHRYYFRMYALDMTLDLPAGVGRDELEKAMQGHILAEGALMGRYSR
jgi:Raf kinase inhibitor-like YbhB/YbcL family protein